MEKNRNSQRNNNSHLPHSSSHHNPQQHQIDLALGEEPPSAAEIERKQEETDNFIDAMVLVNDAVFPFAFKAAIDLGVFEILSKAGPDAKLSAQEIASRIPTRNPDAAGMLARALRVLAFKGALGVKDANYYLTPVSKHFAHNEDGVSLAPLMALTLDKVFLDSWSHLKDGIIDGGGSPFERAHGMQLFEYTARDGRFSQVYNTAMFNHTTLVFREMLKRYTGFEKLKVVVDVGGGIGVALSLITSKYPCIQGINFDLPHVIQYAPPFPGVKHVEGDMFKSIPKGDAIILKWILRDWDDEHCVKLLKNCYAAVPDEGKVIVVEQIFPILADSVNSFTEKTQLDVLSLAQSPGGKERKQHEVIDLGLTAGFACVAFARTVYNYLVLEFTKTQPVYEEPRILLGESLSTFP